MNSFLSTQIPCTLHNVNTDFHIPNILFNRTFVKRLKTNYFPPFKPFCSTMDDDDDDGDDGDDDDGDDDDGDGDGDDGEENGHLHSVTMSMLQQHAHCA